MANLKLKPRTRDRESRQQSLLKAARKLFASKGFETTTTREIAAEAGCAEGLIHRYFRSKQGLLFGILKQQAELEALELVDASHNAQNIEEELLYLVECEIERAWTDREFLKVVVRQGMVDSEVADSISQVNLAGRVKLLAERLRRFPECHEVPQIELEAVAHFVISSGFMFGFMRPVVWQQNQVEARAMAVTMAKLLGRSLAANSFSLEALETLPSLR